jgi:hypothetical protein
VDQVTSKDGVLRARGWAAADDAPEGAVVAAIGEEAGNNILGIGAVTTPREDLAEALGDHLLLSGWELEIPFTGVGDNLCDVQFFAFDNTRGLLTPLQGARPAGCESPDGKMGAYRPDHHSDRGV